jgi:hypothetical protein
VICSDVLSTTPKLRLMVKEFTVKLLGTTLSKSGVQPLLRRKMLLSSLEFMVFK